MDAEKDPCGELVDICAAHNVRVPSCAAHTDDSQQAMIAGRILNKLFDDAEAKGIENWMIDSEQLCDRRGDRD